MDTRASGPGDRPRILLWMACAALVLAGALFLGIAEDVHEGDPLVQTDLRIAVWFHAHGSPALTQCFIVLTNLHALPAVGLYASLLALWLARRREFDWLLALAIAVPGGMALNWVFKLAYERARPVFDDPLLTLDTFSFPSGHAAGATLLYGFVAAYVLPRLRGTAARFACALMLASMVALVALSRVYLGVHFLSDVLAAICAATAWLALCLISVHALQQRRAG